MNAPQSLDGWQAASAIEVCASQLRMAQGRVVGLDLNAWMLACESMGLDKATAIDLKFDVDGHINHLWLDR